MEYIKRAQSPSLLSAGQLNHRLRDRKYSEKVSKLIFLSFAVLGSFLGRFFKICFRALLTKASGLRSVIFTIRKSSKKVQFTPRFHTENKISFSRMSVASDLINKFQRILEGLGPPVNPETDAKKSVAMRPYFCTIRDEIHLETKAFIKIRRAALKRLIEADYNRYMKELRKYDSAIMRTQP